MYDFKVAMVDLHMKPLSVAQDLVPWVKERFADYGIDFVYHPCDSEEELARYAGDADVVWVASGRPVLTADNLHVLDRCGAIVRGGLGYENIPVEAATAQGILVVTTPEIVGAVVEHSVALLLATGRQIPRHSNLVHEGHWDRSIVGPGRLLAGSTLGLVGFGRIAMAMVEKLRGFGLRFAAYDPHVSEEVMAAAGVRKVALAELLRESDLVSIHCALTAETEHLIGEPELRQMQPWAVLVNTARGKIIDEEALYRALSEGWIAAAGLDVMSSEPPDPANPLLKLDNVFVTPHMAPYMHLWPKLQFESAMDKAVALAEGRWPDSVVNRDAVTPRWELT